MADNETITIQMIEDFKRDFRADPKREVLKNAIIKNGIEAVAQNSDSLARNPYTFSHEIKTGKITFQKDSGFCWLYAGLNTIRQKVADRLNIKEFELSQNYLMFWDKLEKANYFLENILENLEEDKYSRALMWLLQNPMQDGGQWNMFTGLVRKYGVVPKYVMPETYHSGKSTLMNKLLNLKLRGHAAALRDMYRQGKSIEALRLRKREMLNEIYRMTAHFLGEPATRFDFEFRDKDDKFHEDRSLTPLDFFQKYAALDIDSYVSLINAPTDDKPFLKTYTVQYLGNIKEDGEVLYLNVDHHTLKSLTVTQLKDNETVWFGCDVGKMMDREKGILDRDLYLYEETLGVKFELDKAGRLDYGDSQLTHAMVFTGVNLVDGRPNRWKVENSWGEEVGDKGYFVMSDSWFDEFTYQAVIQQKHLPPELQKALKHPPILLPPWDPMGSLALMR
jgi:bleomycin hydrolase